MDAIQPLRDEAAKVDSQIKKGEKKFEALSEKHKAEMSPLYARRFEISQIRKRSDRAREELRDTCEDRELLEEYEAVQSELNAADVERGRIQKEIGQLRVWADGDKHEATVTAFHSEATRYEQQAETYQERIAEFEAKLDPLDRSIAELTDRMASPAARGDGLSRRFACNAIPPHPLAEVPRLHLFTASVVDTERRLETAENAEVDPTAALKQAKRSTALGSA
jgi:chromosome segregation ATPase